MSRSTTSKSASPRMIWIKSGFGTSRPAYVCKRGINPFDHKNPVCSPNCQASPLETLTSPILYNLSLESSRILMQTTREPVDNAPLNPSTPLSKSASCREWKLPSALDRHELTYNSRRLCCINLGQGRRPDCEACFTRHNYLACLSGSCGSRRCSG
jgi:hypothetical protein